MGLAGSPYSPQTLSAGRSRQSRQCRNTAALPVLEKRRKHQRWPPGGSDPPGYMLDSAVWQRAEKPGDSAHPSSSQRWRPAGWLIVMETGPSPMFRFFLLNVSLTSRAEWLQQNTVRFCQEPRATRPVQPAHPAPPVQARPSSPAHAPRPVQPRPSSPASPSLTETLEIQLPT